MKLEQAVSTESYDIGHHTLRALGGSPGSLPLQHSARSKQNKGSVQQSAPDGQAQKSRCGSFFSE